ncbi:leucine-rich repeat domain-containing protein [Pseudoflavonifractor phocaeensis]|uniref:leucine-rich repeat domain-containing protein n=1 Tax=Pseudoflavonifractor phocaeensis TaxID=1870988 RepID=UPI00195B7501|nr:leucine-rich repeat domain-containing protein [Pseudoflavonifractor phocaeensis]MBM6938895.1 leucine-rich repeat domain-containing protein [Pseudoflavonifractor phocaeensis]
MSGNSDFVIENGILKKYAGPSGDVVIPEGVITIGYSAFSDCTGLTSVTIPDSVKEIGHFAFSNCTGLTSVTIPNGVKEIGGSAFKGCEGLTSVAIPNSVKKIGYCAFLGCTSLTSVEIAPEHPRFYVENGLVISRKERSVILAPGGLASAFIPDGVKKIHDRAFSGCTGLTSVTIPAGVKRIGEFAFKGCTGLTSVVIPVNITEINGEVFSGCTGLTSVTIPAGVKEIAQAAFRDCTSLTSVTIPEGVKEINWSAFSGCTSLTSVVIPKSVLRIKMDAFAGCTALREVTFLGTPAELHKQAFSGENMAFYTPAMSMAQLPSTEYKQAAARGFALRYAAGTELPEAYRADCLKYIRGQKKKLYPMALQFPPLLHVMLVEKMAPKGDLPDLIDQAASLNKPEVTAMLLDYQDKQLKPGEREQLEEEKMQREMDFILTGTLTAAEAKKSWRYEKDEKGNLTILGYKGKETEVEVPTAIGKDLVTAISDYAFSPNGKPLSEAQRAARRNIRSIRVPEGVETIGKSAFEDCAGLERVEFPASVRKIGGSSYLPDGYKPKPQKTDDPFSGCPALTTVLVAEDNRWYCVEDGLFCRKSKTGRKILGYVGSGEGVCVVPKGTKTIPDYFFQKRGSLTAVSLPEGVDEIGNFAFRDCTGLTSVTIPEGVSKIGRNAFSGCTSLTSVILPTSVTAIDEYAFSGCTSLTSMTIPEGVSKIGRKAFSGCTSLANVILPTSVTAINEETFSRCTSLTSVTIPEGVQAIGKSAFWCCTGLTSVTIPESVTEIGDVAFRGCTSLSSIIIPEGVVRIGQTAFGETPWLEQQKAEHDIVYAGRCVAACRETLAHAEIKDGTRYICNHAFRECTALTSVVIPEGVTEIDWCAFDGCTGLTSVTIPASVTKIGWCAFHDCEHLTIHAPAGSYAQKYAEENHIPFAAE